MVLISPPGRRAALAAGPRLLNVPSDTATHTAFKGATRSVSFDDAVEEQAVSPLSANASARVQIWRRGVDTEVWFTVASK